ncbi:DNA-binding response regulator [Actinoplanes italicus]|uniref:LuxR family two component transcriptional regulator n=1 Tax=Actinoplanes italicus TaxID=113567 RepID=A0A2T0KES3_9ACTN|nr:response regulator transcription factor [Actinoplanes italicus]PRX21892.1 LuxR family two component transcriptional regulator [Actinoplanes italicus]GIE29691.1 DNA-binding response regulator [Actinoplanes italicus]
MRVVICDDSALFRGGLARLLTEIGVEVAAEAGDATDLDRRVAETAPDAVILDIRMPPTFTDEGLTAAARLRRAHPRVGVLVLSTYGETGYAVRLLDLGGSVGYLLKDRVDDAEAVRDAVGRVAAGEIVVDPEIVTRLLHRHRHAELLRGLTEREQAVLAYMAEGRSNAAIAGRLYLAPKTVEGHIAMILSKLQLERAKDDNRRVLAVLTWLRGNG